MEFVYIIAKEYFDQYLLMKTKVITYKEYNGKLE